LDLVLSASRDATVRLWKLLSENPPKYDCSIISHGSAFINSIAYLPSTKDFPDGLVISGGKDTVIEVRQPGKPPEEDAEGLLLGHSHNVCALDVSPAGDFIVSGSWDGSARLWGFGKWECRALLEGHEGSVWTVLAYDPKTIITGVNSTVPGAGLGISRLADCMLHRVCGHANKDLRFEREILTGHTGQQGARPGFMSRPG